MNERTRVIWTEEVPWQNFGAIRTAEKAYRGDRKI